MIKKIFKFLYRKDLSENKLNNNYQNNQQVLDDKKYYCPYCNHELPERKTKFKCSECKKEVFVKKINGVNQYFTEQENSKLIFEKKFNSMKKKNFNDLINIGYPINELERDFTMSNINSINGLKDFIWQSYNLMLSKSSSDLFKQHSIYYSMAIFSNNYEDGKDTQRLLKLSADTRLKKISEQFDDKGLFHIKIIILGQKENKYCALDNKKVFDIEYLMQNPIIPHNKDGDKFCTCFYNAQIERDPDGKLIIYNLD